jgi:methylphosphotriester-DNA--protein-cysteine methyltransferase
MNEHIRRGNEAVFRGNRDEAILEFYEALADPDPMVQRIAGNRLRELTPDVVFASSSSSLYHRAECAAKQAIWKNHLITFNDWRKAESAGYRGCPMCKPPRPTVTPQGGV